MGFKTNMGPHNTWITQNVIPTIYSCHLYGFWFQMVATDQSLADSTIESEKANSSIHTSSQQLKHVNENFTPSFHQTLRQISSSQVLQLLAHERYVHILGQFHVQTTDQG